MASWLPERKACHAMPRTESQERGNIIISTISRSRLGTFMTSRLHDFNYFSLPAITTLALARDDTYRPRSNQHVPVHIWGCQSNPRTDVCICRIRPPGTRCEAQGREEQQKQQQGARRQRRPGKTAGTRRGGPGLGIRFCGAAVSSGQGEYKFGMKRSRG